MTQVLSCLKGAILAADRPSVTLLIGLPGSGKSRWVKNNAAGLTIISTDDLLEAWASENGKTYSDAFNVPGLFREVEKQMYANLVLAAERGDHLIIDRTNLSKKVRSKVFGRIPAHYLKFAALFIVERAELDRRLAERAERTGKIIFKEVVDDMLSRYEPPTMDEFDEIFV